MKVHSPFVMIRGLPGLRIGDDYIVMDYDPREAPSETPSGQGFVTWFHIGKQTFADDTLRSPAATPCTLQDAWRSMLSFLMAAGEAYHCRLSGRVPSENINLFKPEVVAWAYEHEHEIALLATDLDDLLHWIGEVPRCYNCGNARRNRQKVGLPDTWICAACKSIWVPRAKTLIIEE